jgi:hypothetical protein
MPNGLVTIWENENVVLSWNVTDVDSNPSLLRTKATFQRQTPFGWEAFSCVLLNEEGLQEVRGPTSSCNQAVQITHGTVFLAGSVNEVAPLETPKWVLLACSTLTYSPRRHAPVRLDTL